MACQTGNLQVLSGSGCPESFVPSGPFPSFITIDESGMVCDTELTAQNVPAENNWNITAPNIETVQGQLDYLCANLGNTSSFTTTIDPNSGLVETFSHNSGAPGATDTDITINAASIPFDPSNCVGYTTFNLQDAIDELCTQVQGLGGGHPAATVGGASNTALSIVVGTQVLTLDLTAAGSYDNTVCAGTLAGMPDDVQGAIDFLCARACLTVTNNYDNTNCHGSYDCATNTLNISPFPSAGRGEFGFNQAIPANVFTPFPVMNTIFTNLPASFAPPATNTLVVPRDGEYSITATIGWQNVVAGNSTIRILRNGVEIGRHTSQDVSAGEIVINSRFFAGDIITAEVRAVNGGNLILATLGAIGLNCNT